MPLPEPLQAIDSIDGLLRQLAGIQPVAIDERHERAGEIGQ
jgi:hypothetical protein